MAVKEPFVFSELQQLFDADSESLTDDMYEPCFNGLCFGQLSVNMTDEVYPSAIPDVHMDKGNLWYKVSKIFELI